MRWPVGGLTTTAAAAARADAACPTSSRPPRQALSQPTMTRTHRRGWRRSIAAIALLAVPLTGCTSTTRVGARPGGVVVNSANTGWATKKVVTKKPPEALMALDGTICRVSPDRFKDTAVGALVPCNWQ